MKYEMGRIAILGFPTHIFIPNSKFLIPNYLDSLNYRNMYLHRLQTTLAKCVYSVRAFRYSLLRDLLFKFFAEAFDGESHWPCCSFTERADRATFDVLRNVMQQVDIARHS